MKKHQGKISILIVPEEEGQPKSIKLSGPLIIVLKIAGIALICAFIAGAVSYFFLWKKTLNYDRMASENISLLEDNRRVQKLAEEVERLRGLDQRIRKALGVDFEKDTTESTAEEEVPIAELTSPGSFFDNYSPIFIKPVEGMISRGFSEEFFPGISHTGMDIAVAVGTIVSASSDGWVVFEGWHPRYGNLLIIQHPGDYMTFYGHLSNVLVAAGEKVSAGDAIALSGNSGRSSAPHLHFEIRNRGKYLDPAKYIADFENTAVSGSNSDNTGL